jgi:hypothetical protein
MLRPEAEAATAEDEARALLSKIDNRIRVAHEDRYDRTS